MSVRCDTEESFGPGSLAEKNGIGRRKRGKGKNTDKKGGLPCGMAKSKFKRSEPLRRSK